MSIDLNPTIVRLLNITASAALLVASNIGVSAQVAPGIQKGTTELGAFVGASYGTDAFRVMGGGNVSYSVTTNLLPYAEFSYFPGLPRKATKLEPDGTRATQSFDLPLADFHAGLHIRIPLPERRFVPYIVIGAGIIHNYSASYNLAYTDIFGKPQNDPQTRAAANSFAVNFGGGIRYYIDQRFGIRFEAKAYRATGSIDDIFSKYEFGVFYQIH